MQIPEDRNDLSFLKGCWRSTSKITNGNTGNEITITYCFTDDGGRGTVSILDVGVNCKGKLTGKRVGDGVEMDQDEPRCDNGSSYTPAIITCRPSGRGALCDIKDIINGRVEPESKQVHGAQFIRLE